MPVIPIASAPTILSPSRRVEVLSALRRGAVPNTGLDVLAVGLDRFERAIDEELAQVALGHGGFKAIRGEYGTGKTFCVRWIEERARAQGFATTEVQISETETPLHKLETVYRRAMERIRTANTTTGALADIVERWFFALESDVLEGSDVDADDEEAIEDAISALMERRLAEVTRSTPQFAATLRAYHAAQRASDFGTAQGLMAWLGGQPNVGSAVKRKADLKGDIDHYGALSFLEGLLVVLRDSGIKGLVLILDEVETLQRVRSDVREKSLNALRQLIDEVDQGRFPGLYVMITGTPSFFDGPQGVQRLAPLAQRLATDFSTDARFDNPRAVQLRLSGFRQEQLVELGLKIRDIFAEGADHGERVRKAVDDAYVADLAQAMAGKFGGDVRIAPRIFLKKLIADVLDRVDLFADFDPRQHYALTISREELNPEERAAVYGDVDGIELDLDV
ncbi:MAG: BREX system ATP-binding protein BrxD [Bradymonadaceae bacterium]|nr:BREX system ATP-binding protein BrxD [Lujinxingiaceae bacterium]